jgi:membrane protein DedA with SNARE-associated domain
VSDVLAEFTALILAYKYWALFPLALFEAPLMSIVIGFLGAAGYLHLYIAFGIIVLGDSIGDTVLYVFGRWCRPLFEKVGLRLNLSSEHVRTVLDYFGKRDRRAIVISKLVHGIGFTGLIVAGSVRVPFRRFIVTCTIVTICQSAVLAAVGMLSGQAYQAFARVLGYLDVVVAAVFLLALFILYRTLIQKIGRGKAKLAPDTMQPLRSKDRLPLASRETGKGKML